MLPRQIKAAMDRLLGFSAVLVTERLSEAGPVLGKLIGLRIVSAPRAVVCQPAHLLRSA